MYRFSANLTFLFREHDFADRFEAARNAGFRFVEMAFPYELSAQVIKDQLVKNDLKQVLFNMPPGDLKAGDLGLASNPDRIDEFRQGVDRALEYARILDVSRINCLSGKRIDGVPYEEQWRVLTENIQYTASRLAEDNRVLTVEPLNTGDFPGFLLSHSNEVVNLIEQIKAPNIKLQYDLYHMQKMEGNLIATIRRYFHHIGHIQVGDNPDRMPPGTGEINVVNVIRELGRLEYQGFIGLEYNAVPDTTSALQWLHQAELFPQ
jgi:hydroxypyruvate isomerase